MIKYLLLIFTITGCSNLKEVKKSNYFLYKNKKLVKLSEAKRAIASDTHKAIYNNVYPNGDVYILIGDLGKTSVDKEFKMFTELAGWFSKAGYRVIVNPVAYPSDIQEAASNPNTVAIIWSSHGTESSIFDHDAKSIPKNAFNPKDVSKRLKYILFSSCYGKCAQEVYEFSDGVKKYGWKSKTYSSELISYLMSKNFNNHFFEAVGNPKSKCTDLLKEFL